MPLLLKKNDFLDTFPCYITSHVVHLERSGKRRNTDENQQFKKGNGDLKLIIVSYFSGVLKWKYVRLKELTVFRSTETETSFFKTNVQVSALCNLNSIKFFKYQDWKHEPKSKLLILYTTLNTKNASV